MVWRIELTETAARQLSKLGSTDARRIVKFLRTHVIGPAGPRGTGKVLSGPLGGLWRYRVGDYRLICEIRDDVLEVLVIKIAHRRDAYR